MSVCASQNIVKTISCRVFDAFSLKVHSDALWDRDERFFKFTIWGQKVKGQDHGGIKYAENSIFWLVNTIS